jgi:hypothetical protein
LFAVPLDHQLGPVASQVPAEIGAGEEFVDQLGTLVRLLAFEETAGSVQGRQSAREIKMDPANKFGIVTPGRKGNPVTGELFVDELIEPMRYLFRRMLGPTRECEEPGQGGDSKEAVHSSCPCLEGRARRV